KWAGIYVHRFSLGLGSPIRALSFRRGETEYAISWFPLGGYVKMASREEDATAAALEGAAPAVAVPPDRVYEAKPVWKRMIVILAGVTMNALFAWGIYSGLAYVQGVSVYPITRIGRIDAALLPEAAAEVARLEPGDRIVRVGGRAVDTWDQVMREIVTGPSDSIVIEVEGREPVVARIHRDALAERDQVARAIEPLIPPVIGQVVSGRPAARAGVQVGDTIVAVDGAPVEQWPQVVDLIQARPDEEITLTVGRAGGRSQITARTVAEEEKDSTGRTRTVGRLGLGPHIDERYEPVSLGAALGHGARQTAFVSTTIVRLLRGMASGRVSTREVGGPIAIGMQAGQSARLGLAVFLGYMALISVNLAVLNLLPIPVLDGGQFLFLVGEAVLRRPLSPRLRERLTAVGLFLLLLLTVLAFSNDIRRLLGL
ncbi:MAG TPA: RIP metalloprotease RseP, partial [Gemmatimonadales bacterium]|nr:RIP metalloprotease RseP [Gemmatimonadales bacterium]